jgi:hypothetical protein
MFSGHPPQNPVILALVFRVSFFLLGFPETLSSPYFHHPFSQHGQRIPIVLLLWTMWLYQHFYIDLVIPCFYQFPIHLCPFSGRTPSLRSSFPYYESLLHIFGHRSSISNHYSCSVIILNLYVYGMEKWIKFERNCASRMFPKDYLQLAARHIGHAVLCLNRRRSISNTFATFNSVLRSQSTLEGK